MVLIDIPFTGYSNFRTLPLRRRYTQTRMPELRHLIKVAFEPTNLLAHAVSNLPVRYLVPYTKFGPTRRQ